MLNRFYFTFLIFFTAAWITFGKVPDDVPRWTDIVDLKASYNNGYLILVMEMSDTIPHVVQDSSVFQFLLDTDSDETTGFYFDSLGVDNVIQFNHNNWDGSRWNVMFLIGKINETLFPGEHHRMFDWKLDANTLSVRLSLTALEWSSIKIKGRVFYGTQFADVFPDNGYITLEVDSANISGLEIASTKHTVFTYPEEFDSVLIKNHIPLVLDAAYELEHELTGIIPIGGDPLRFTFHPLYDGAAIEGDPIYIGPGMWGKFPLWFVYFHEMGHNYCNASERFGQLYPLMLSVPPGPLPTNILYYEGFASLPAMYVYEQIEKNPTILDIDPTITKEIIEDWQNVKRRFISAWNKYKDNPISTSLNPDIVDGLILELVEEYGWDIFREFYWLLRPVDKPLPLFNKHLPGDTPDLAKTRSTFTVALFSAAANVDLSKRFKEWGFPIDDELFDSAFSELIVQMKIPHDIHN